MLEKTLRSEKQWASALTWLALVVYSLIIFFFSSQPGEDLTLPAPDYLLHGVEYLGLGFLSLLAFSGVPVFAGLSSALFRLAAFSGHGWKEASGQKLKASEPATMGFRAKMGWRVFLIAFVFCLLYAASDEIHQMFVPGRTASGWDWLADALGSAGGIAAAWVWVRIRCRCFPRQPDR